MNKLPALKFKDGKFKIMLVGDLHESYGDNSEESKKKTADTLKLLNRSLDALKPDLVVYLGDIGKANEEDKMRSVISRVTYPVSSRNIPLAIVFGNHDRECEISLERQLELYAQEYDKFYTSDPIPELTGCGNCNVLVKDSKGKKDILNLWFVDSNNLCDNRELSYYDWVHEDQIEWYKSTTNEIKEKNGRTIPALWFMHIPVPEEYELLREAKPYEIPDSVKGHGTRSKINYVLKDHIEGYMGEGPCVSEVNSGVFKAWKETGDVMGAFFGHDHMNDFIGYYDGILLGQNKLAGFKPYTDGCRSGVRLITLDENNVEDINSKMYYFKKDFGLKSESLGPVERNFTDRQVIKIKAASWIAGGVAAATTAAVAVNKIKKSK